MGSYVAHVPAFYRICENQLSSSLRNKRTNKTWHNLIDVGIGLTTAAVSTITQNKVYIYWHMQWLRMSLPCRKWCRPWESTEWSNFHQARQHSLQAFTHAIHNTLIQNSDSEIGATECCTSDNMNSSLLLLALVTIPPYWIRSLDLEMKTRQHM